MTACKRCSTAIGPRTKNSLCRSCTAELLAWRVENGQANHRRSRVTDEMIVAGIEAGASSTRALMELLDWKDARQLRTRVDRLAGQGRCQVVRHPRPRGFEYLPVATIE